MSQKQAVQLRAKIIGVLIRDARLAAGKSMKEAGEAIGATGGRIVSMERGTRPPSLPELEVLAYYLETPIDHFWKEEIVSEDSRPIESIQADVLLGQRNRTIGATLRQARNENNLSQRDLAKRSGISATRIRRYENGEAAVPLPELEQLAATLYFKVEDFSAKSGPVGDWIAQQQSIEEFLKLPKALQEFVGNQDHRPHLEMARRLSDMSPERLRAVAEGLRELSH